MASGRLTEAQIKKGLSRLNGWSMNNGCLKKEFKFANFVAAMDFMNALVPVAERLNHHPDWSNSYNTVVVSLTTHSVGGLSEKDLAFAEAADKAGKI